MCSRAQLLNMVVRSMDWLQQTQDAKIEPIRQGTPMEGKAPDGTAGYSWVTKTNYLPVTAYGSKNCAQGQSSTLAFAANMLLATDYPAPPPPQLYSQSLGISEMGHLTLGTCETIDELITFFRENVANYVEYKNEQYVKQIPRDPAKQIYFYGDDLIANKPVPGLHFAWGDSEGNSFIIDAIDGYLIGYTSEKIYTGVMTNNPIPVTVAHIAQFGSQMNNLPAPPISIGNATITSVDAVASYGLPGDDSSLSRAVRLSYAVKEAIPIIQKYNSEGDKVNEAFNVIDKVKVIKGAVEQPISTIPSDLFDLTIYQVVSYFTNGNSKMYWRNPNMDQGSIFYLDLQKVFAQEGKLNAIHVLQSLELSYYDLSSMPGSETTVRLPEEFELSESSIKKFELLKIA